MIAQVAPLISMSNATDVYYWIDLGWKGALGTIALVAVLFAVYKGKVGFVSIGPSEAGIREFCGFRLYRVGPGLHPDIEGVWKVRKASVARIRIKVEEEFKTGDEQSLSSLTWQYAVTVLLKVADTKEALTAQIYTASDTKRENMQNSEAEEQATDMLMRAVRVMLEGEPSADFVEKYLQSVVKDELLEDYGYEIVRVWVLKLVKRPQSEIAEAITHGRLSNGIIGVVAGDTERPSLEAIKSEPA